MMKKVLPQWKGPFFGFVKICYTIFVRKQTYRYFGLIQGCCLYE